MYIGSTDTRGLMHCLWEIIDNGVDEALAGAARSIEVTLHPDDSAEVYDDGRGIPVDKEPKTGLPGVEVVYTHLHAGGKFGGGSYVATGGLHGVGASVVNALSSRLDVDVDRSPSRQGISFRRGVAGVFDGEGPKAGFTPKSGLTRKGKRVAKGRTGTRVRFWPDRQIFTKDARFVFDDLVTRARQTSYIVPGLELVIRDLRGPDPREEKFRHDGGITEFTEFLSTGEAVTDVLRLQGAETFTETVPLLDEKGHMTPQEVERELQVDVALRWNTGYDTELRSFVNVIATPKGGTHVSGFESALTSTFNDVMRSTKALRVNDDNVIKDDVLEGLTAVVTVRLAEPQFEGQTKEILGTPAARSVVRRVVSSELKKFLTSTKRAEKAQARLVMEKVVGASKTRLAARQHKETQRRKNALESSALSPRRCRPSCATAGPTTTSAPSCSSSRATPRSARPRTPATPNTRHCCRSGARSSTSRRPRSATCSRTPSAPRSSRSSAPAPAAPSTSRHGATAESSSWPTPTPTAPTSGACWPPCSSSTCPS
jgi:DNA gyrase subunit B